MDSFGRRICTEITEKMFVPNLNKIGKPLRAVECRYIHAYYNIKSFKNTQNTGSEDQDRWSFHGTNEYRILLVPGHLNCSNFPMEIR